MTAALHISPQLSFPLQAATETFGILAVKRSGKSNAAVVMAESMFDAGIPWVAIDPKGDWWGLRSSGDGKGPGLPILVFGGDHADIPLEPTAGKLMADLIATKHLTCVLDVSTMTKADTRRFLTDFATSLYRLNREPLHVFCEEADEYIPQRFTNEAAKMVGAFENLVKRGGFRGIGVTLITQRSASLNKDVTTQIGTLIALRTTGPQDRKVIEDWTKHHQTGAEAVGTLATLKNGEAWVFSPEFLDRLVRIKFRRRRTFDSGETPKVGQKRREPVNLADVDLDDIRAQMADTIERAKDNDPAELRKRIRHLEGELAAAANSAPNPEHFIEYRIPKELLDGFIATRDAVSDLGFLVEDKVTSVTKALAQIPDGPVKVGPPDKPTMTTNAILNGEAPPAEAAFTEPRGSVRMVKAPTGTAPEGIGTSHRKILDALAWLESVGLIDPDRKQVGYLAGYTASGGTFQKYVSTMATADLITYPRKGTVALTDAGRALAAKPEAPLTDAALQQAFYDRLPTPLAKILAHLVHLYPAGIAREPLGEATGYEASGGTFQKYISTLSSLGLVDYPERGYVAASASLFLGGGS